MREQGSGTREVFQRATENLPGSLLELPTPFLDLKRKLYLLLRKGKYRTEILRRFLEHIADHPEI